MLVLSRRKHEEIVLVLPDGTPLRVLVVDIRGEKVRIGIEAPKSVVVHRKEIYAKALLEGNVRRPAGAKAVGDA